MKTLEPGKYRHYKGQDYEVIMVVRHSETLEMMVVYKQLYGEGAYWTRPMYMFDEIIDFGGNEIKRFERIG